MAQSTSGGATRPTGRTVTGGRSAQFETWIESTLGVQKGIRNGDASEGYSISRAPK